MLSGIFEILKILEIWGFFEPVFIFSKNPPKFQNFQKTKYMY